MNDVGKILDTLANRWENLTTVEKNALASAIAGVRQRENFIVLMDNYETAIKYTEEAMNSAGTAMEKYDAYLQSIEASQAKLKATFEDFSRALVDSGVIKGFYDFSRGSLQLLANLLKLKPVLIALFSFLIGKGSAVAILKIVDSLKKMTYATKAGNGAFKQGVTNIKMYIQSLNSSKTALVTTEQAAQIAAGRMALVQIATTALTAVVMGLIAAYQNHQQQIEENIEKAKEHIQTVKEEQETLADLKQQYIDLSKSENYNDETRKSVQSVQEEINKLVGAEADGIDLVNGKLDDQLKKLDEISIKTAQSNLEELYGKLSTIRQNLGSALLTYAESKIAGERGVIEGVFTFKGLYAAYSDIYKGLNENQELTYEQALKYLERLKEARSELNPDTENKAWNILDKVIGRLQTRITDYDAALNTYNRTQAQAVVGADLFYNKVKIDSKEAYNSYIESLKNAKDENGNLLYSEEAIQAMIEVLSEKFPQYSDKIDTSSDSTSNFTKSLKDLKEKLQSAKEAYEVLNSAINEYNSNGSISYDTWEKLLEVEDQYLSVLIDENGQIKANNKALQDLMKAQIEEITLKRMKQYVDNLLTAAQQGNLDTILLSTEGLEANTNARLQNIMAVIASNPELMKHSKVILQNLSAMAQLTDTISLGSDSTKDATDATEDWEKVLDYANTILDEQIEKLEAEQEALEKLTEEKIKAHEAEIKRLEEEKEALEEKNEEKNKELELEELERNLQKAKQRTMRVYHEGKGWVWEQDPEALQEAQQELDDFYTEQQIENIEDLIEAEEEKIEELENNLDKEIKTYEERIKAIKDYKDEWNKVKTEHEKAQNEIIAKAKLGANAEKEILMGIDGKGGRLKILDDFKKGYTKALGEVAKKTKESVNSINTSLGKFDFEALKELLIGIGSGKTEDRGKFGNYKLVKGEEDENGVRIKYVLDKDSGRYYKEADLAEWEGEYYYTKGTSYFGKAYASGTLTARAGLATVDEKGNELIVPRQGRYRMMEYGDTVVPHNLSQRLFEVASNPLRFIANALNSVKTPNLMSNSNQVSNSSTIHIGTIELPSVTNGENFVRQLQLIAANR